MSTAVMAAEAATPDLCGRLARDLDDTFPDLVGVFGSLVYTTALRTTGSPADAEDLAAETFLRAYVALRGYASERIRALHVRAWLVTILLNMRRNQVRAAGRRPPQVPLDAAPDPPSEKNDEPHERAVRRDTADHLATLLARLPETQRLTVVLRHVGELSYEEIAEVLRIPEGTAKSHVSRGLRRLRTLASNAGLLEALR